MFFSFISFLLISFVNANIYGVDVSQAVSQSTASCFKKQGIEFLIARGFRCSGVVDKALAQTYQSVVKSGIKHFGVYVFPCAHAGCASADSQVQKLANSLKSQNINVDSVWLDIESSGPCTWDKDVQKSMQFYKDLVSAGLKYFNGKLGIYANYNQYVSIFGTSSFVNPGDEKLKLWYAQYDNSERFRGFGSWKTSSSAYAKQYLGDIHLCDFGVDLNVAPTFFGLPASSSVPQWQEKCTYQGQTGYCRTSSACSGSTHSSSSGAVGCKRFPGSVTCCIGGTHAPTSTAAPPSTPRPTPHSTPQPTPHATARPTPRRTAATLPPSPRHTTAHASASTAAHSVASRSSVHIYTPPHAPTSSTQHTPSSSTHPIVHTSTAASPPHTPAAGKRALFREPLVIVIACAVGGVLLLTCLAALVVFLCVARQRRKRRLQARTMLRKRRANTRPKQFTVV